MNRLLQLMKTVIDKISEIVTILSRLADFFLIGATRVYFVVQGPNGRIQEGSNMDLVFDKAGQFYEVEVQFLKGTDPGSIDGLAVIDNSNPVVASVSWDPSNRKLTIVGLDEGSSVIRVSADGDLSPGVLPITGTINANVSFPIPPIIGADTVAFVAGPRQEPSA